MAEDIKNAVFMQLGIKSGDLVELNSSWWSQTKTNLWVGDPNRRNHAWVETDKFLVHSDFFDFKEYFHKVFLFLNVAKINHPSVKNVINFDLLFYDKKMSVMVRPSRSGIVEPVIAKPVVHLL